MKNNFDLKKSIIKVVLFITVIFTLLCILIISSYLFQIKRYEEILTNITSSNNISVKANNIIDKKIYAFLSNPNDIKEKQEILLNLEQLKEEMNILYSSTEYENEIDVLRVSSNLLDSFIEKCINILEDSNMKNKIKMYEEADSLYEYLSHDINNYITIQIENRGKVVAKLQKYTTYIFITSFSISIILLVYFISYGIKSASKAAKIISDEIEEREKTQNQLNHLANYDQLTQLVNRRYFTSKVCEYLSQTLFDKRMTFLFLDLDGFKYVNDTFGHDAGDEVLKNTAERLLKCTSNIDVVARMGGDEFCIFKPEYCSKEDLANLCSNIIQEICKDIIYKDNKLNVTVSIGVSIFPYHGKNYDALIATADEAMYKAKYSGKNQYFIYNINNNVLL